MEDWTGRYRIIEIWSLRAATLFTALVALFLAGFSLPGDFEEKRIYLVVTKPVSKITVFLGKYLGFVMLLAIFVGLMGFASILFLRGAQLVAGASFPEVAAYPRAGASEFDHVHGSRDEKRDPPRLMISAIQNGALIWKFRGLHRSDFPASAQLETRLVMGSPYDRLRASGTALVTIRNPVNGETAAYQRFIQTHEENRFNFPATLVSEDGSLDVIVRASDPDGAIAGWTDSAKLYERPRNFELNFALGMLLVLLQSLLVLSATMMATTFLSAPLSIIMGILVVLIGSVHSFALEGARQIDRSLEQIQEHPEEELHTPEGLPEWILAPSTFVAKLALTAVPDFSNFDFSHWLLKDHALTWKEVGQAALLAAPLVIATMLVSVFFMAFKDFK